MNAEEFFICPGASKAGTTSLYDIFKYHPEIALTTKKETQFFVREELLEQGRDFYFKNFFNVSGRKLKGEICPQYMSSDQTPKRIFETLGPQVKILLLFRNPVDRFISHYFMKTRTIEEDHLSTVLDQILHPINHFDPVQRQYIQKHLTFNRFRDFGKSEWDKHAYRYTRYVYPGLYSTILSEYLQYFPKSQIKIIIFEEFVKNVEKTIEDITSFLGISSTFSYDRGKQSNQRKIYKNSLSKKIRNMSFLLPIKFKQGIRRTLGSKFYDIAKARMESPFISKGKPFIAPEDRHRIWQFYQPEVDSLKMMINNKLDVWI